MKTHAAIRTRAAVLSAAVLALVGGVSLRAQEPDPEATRAMQRFLRLDCGVGEGEEPLGAILVHRAAIEPELERILREGPEDSVIAEVGAAAEERWTRLEAYLQSDPHLGLDPQARLDVTTLTRDEFVSRAVARFTHGYLERAVIGLVAIGSPSALRTLHDVRNTADEELAGFIDSTLRRQRPAGRGSDPRRRTRPGAAIAGREPRRPARD